MTTKPRCQECGCPLPDASVPVCEECAAVLALLSDEEPLSDYQATALDRFLEAKALSEADTEDVQPVSEESEEDEWTTVDI